MSSIQALEGLCKGKLRWVMLIAVDDALDVRAAPPAMIRAWSSIAGSNQTT